MPNPRLASRYAKSILDLASEKGQLESVYADMEWLQAVCKSNRDFVSLLRSPIIKADKKKAIVQAITKGKVSELTAAFNNLLIAKGREQFLPEIITAYIRAYKAHKNIQTVTLTTATPISEEVKQGIINQLKPSLGANATIELEENVDEGLIGGFVLQVGDKLIDASILHDFKAISRQFDKNDFIYNVR